MKGRYQLLKRIKKWFKYKYLLLLRAKGGPSKVAKGFSIGLFIEMFTLPTIGIAFFLIFPLVYFFRASFAGALIGFVFGKVIYTAVFLLNKRVGGLVVSRAVEMRLHEMLPDWLGKVFVFNLKLIVGGIIDGAIMGIIVYFPVRLLLEVYARRRTEKRKLRKKARLQEK
ncbi:MAG TPA: DUF2062 domain-containing protein [Bacilli bacterium]